MSLDLTWSLLPHVENFVDECVCRSLRWHGLYLTYYIAAVGGQRQVVLVSGPESQAIAALALSQPDESA